ncbi:MAG: hypothetical protein GKR87_04825 [Kiritimatiellae bacterium]|nr:hypothetical protein [Kiritimatiellia bacterium]
MSPKTPSEAIADGFRFKSVQFYIPIWLPLDSFIRSIPHVGPKILSFLPVPCANYLHLGLTRKQRIEWAIMDTYDQLGARYDMPKTLEEVQDMVDSSDNDTVEVFYGSNGVVANIGKI